MSSVQRRSVRLGRPTRLGLYIVGIGVWLTGGLWLLFHYFLVSQGEFGQAANPLERWWLKLHGAFAFASIWMFGLVWAVHVTNAWPYARRRWSGSVMGGVLAWLILSGYLLYYVGDDKARSIVSALHWVVGLTVPLLFLWHRISFRVQRPNSALEVEGAASSLSRAPAESHDVFGAGNGDGTQLTEVRRGPSATEKQKGISCSNAGKRG